MKNLSSAIKLYAEKTPDKVYMTDKDVEYTYAQTNGLMNRICFLFESLGLKQGDIISAVIKNSAEYILLYLSALRYGCVFNPYPHTMEPNDISRYLKKLNPKIFFCRKEHSKISKAFVVKNDFIQTLKKTDKEYDFVPKEKSPACMYYSSGTTDNPKTVVYSHKNMIALISSIVKCFKFTEKERHLLILPLGHTASTNYSFLPCTLCGGSMVIAESFWKVRANFWDRIKKYGITYVEVVPSILTALLNTPYKKEAYSNITSLPYIGCGSSTLPKTIQIKFIEKYDLKVANLYGLSETGPTHVDDPREEGWKPGSAGKPLDVNDIKIMDENDKVLPPGKVGEITVKGDNVFIAYYKNQEMYDKVVRNGYFHTGDVGYVDKEDRLFFVGREKDLIIKGGVNISPEEIDEVIYEIEEVAECLTVGIPDNYLGERIISFIVLKEGKTLGKESILKFCEKYLSKNKLPDVIKFAESLPKGPSGKLLRKEMRRRINEGLIK